jgi:hypothetical protein
MATWYIRSQNYLHCLSLRHLLMCFVSALSKVPFLKLVQPRDRCDEPSVRHSSPARHHPLSVSRQAFSPFQQSK